MVYIDPFMHRKFSPRHSWSWVSLPWPASKSSNSPHMLLSVSLTRTKVAIIMWKLAQWDSSFSGPMRIEAWRPKKQCNWIATRVEGNNKIDDQPCGMYLVMPAGHLLSLTQWLWHHIGWMFQRDPYGSWNHAKWRQGLTRFHGGKIKQEPGKSAPSILKFFQESVHSRIVHLGDRDETKKRLVLKEKKL